jgi:hypothetical protein
MGRLIQFWSISIKRSGVVTFKGMKLFLGIVGSITPVGDPDWGRPNPSDQKMMHKAFNDLHVVSCLALTLKEPEAATFEEFQSQVRRLGLYVGLIR